MIDAYLNPLSGDYVLQQGQPAEDPANGLANAVYVRLMTPLGSWWQDVNLGSRLHELTRQKDLSRVSILAKQYSETALQPVIDDGRATEIVVTTEQPKNGRLLLHIQVTAASGELFHFEQFVEVH